MACRAPCAACCAASPPMRPTGAALLRPAPRQRRADAAATAVPSSGSHLVHPVAVQHAQAAAAAAHALLGKGAVVAVGLELGDTLVDGLAVHDTLRATGGGALSGGGRGPSVRRAQRQRQRRSQNGQGEDGGGGGGAGAPHLVHRALAAAAADAHTIDDVALLGLEAHAARLVGPAGMRQPDDAGQLPVLPAADAEEEAEHIALLLPPQLLHILQTYARNVSLSAAGGELAVPAGRQAAETPGELGSRGCQHPLTPPSHR